MYYHIHISYNSPELISTVPEGKFFPRKFFQRQLFKKPISFQEFQGIQNFPGKIFLGRIDTHAFFASYSPGPGNMSRYILVLLLYYNFEHVKFTFCTGPSSRGPLGCPGRGPLVGRQVVMKDDNMRLYCH